MSCRLRTSAMLYTAWGSEIGSLWSTNAPEFHASSDVRGPISLHQAVLTSCPARRCSGIRAQLCRFAPVAPDLLNFVTSNSLLLAALNFVVSFLCSAHALSFVASLWSAQLPRLPIDRSTHRKAIEKLCFAVNFCGLENIYRPFSNGKTKTLSSWLLPLLEAAFCFSGPDLSPCRAETCFFSLQSVPLFQLVSVTGGFALLVAVRPNFFHCNFSKKPCERSGT